MGRVLSPGSVGEGNLLLDFDSTAILGSGPHGISSGIWRCIYIAQNIYLFINTAVRTSELK
jgi:hypothetical protein